MRDLSVLSDVEFEELVADLFAAELGVNVERFARGADGGVDLRWPDESGTYGVGQCKHYIRSTFAQELLAAARKELAHLGDLDPATYRFVTSQDLTPGQKDSLVHALSPFVARPDAVLGSRDLDGLITRFPNVERAHPKLWLSTGTQLFWATHADLAHRTSALRARIQAALPRYVMNESFARGSAILDENRVCLIAGLPGIGKTTLAYALLADAMSRGYEPVEVSADISDAWTAYQPEARQVFLYDDFLGQLTFSERLGKNEDARLADFIARVSDTKSKLLIMTTREYILQDAERLYSKLAAIGQNKRLVLELSDYTRRDRARILYNHLWQADLPAAALAEVATGGCIEIVDHPNYSPRLIEYCTGPAFDRTTPGYGKRFVASLEHPERLWRTAFEDHLTEGQQLTAIVLATLPAEVNLDDLADAYESLCQKRGLGGTAAQFRTALQVLEGSFVASDMVDGTSRVRFHNPSIRAFVLDWIARDHRLVCDLIDSAVFFEQVGNLHQFTTGRRGTIRTGEASAFALSNIIAQESERMTQALMRLMTSPTPETGGRYVSDRTRPVTSWFEDRLLLLNELPPELLPPEPWMSTQLEAATLRWQDSQGRKDRAAQLVAALEGDAKPRFGAAAIDSATAVLDTWLASELVETDEDWLPYLDRLERRQGVWLPEAHDIAERFEEHATEELSRWSPSPPNLSDLIEYAERFELLELKDALEERAREDDAREEHQRETEPESRRYADRSPSARITDAEISSMFARLVHGREETA